MKPIYVYTSAILMVVALIIATAICQKETEAEMTIQRQKKERILEEEERILDEEQKARKEAYKYTEPLDNRWGENYSSVPIATSEHE